MLGPKNFAGNTSCTWQLGKPRGLLRFWGLGSRFFKELVVRQLNLEFKAIVVAAVLQLKHQLNHHFSTPKPGFTHGDLQIPLVS